MSNAKNVKADFQKHLLLFYLSYCQYAEKQELVLHCVFNEKRIEKSNYNAIHAMY